MYNIDKLSDYVDAGIEYLDKNYATLAGCPGIQWRKLIDLNKLDMRHNCICDQLRLFGKPRVTQSDNIDNIPSLRRDMKLGFDMPELCKNHLILVNLWKEKLA